MANRIVKYEYSAGIGVTLGSDTGVKLIGDSIPSTTSTDAYGAAADASGNIYFSDHQQSVVYRVDESGDVFLFAGVHGVAGNVDGKAAVAKFSSPAGVACDRTGNVYVADSGNNSVRKIDRNGNVTTIASSITAPEGVAVNATGVVYVTANHAVYQIMPNGATAPLAAEKIVLAGSPGVSGDVAGLSGSNKVYGSTARFNTPKGVAVDASGSVYVADAGNNKVKKIGSDGWVVRYTGNGSSGDVLGTQAAAEFSGMGFLVVDRSGSLFLVDQGGTKLKRIDLNGNVTEISPTNSHSIGVAVTPGGRVYVVESAGAAPGTSSSTSSHSPSTLSSESLSSNSSSSKSVSTSSSFSHSMSSSSSRLG